MSKSANGKASAEEVLAARHIGVQLLRVRRRSGRAFDIEVDYTSPNPSIMRREWDRRSANDDVVSEGTAWFPLLFLRLEWDRSSARFTQLVRAAKLDMRGGRNAWASLSMARNETLLWFSIGVWACVKADAGKGCGPGLGSDFMRRTPASKKPLRLQKREPTSTKPS